MVIAHVLSSFRVGGQEAMAVELARRQVAKGNRVFAFSLAQPANEPLERAFVEGGVTPLHVTKLGPSVDVTLVPRLAFAFRHASITVVHLHNHQPLIYGALAGKIAGCRVVATRHGLLEGGGRQLWLKRQAARFADAYVAVSKEVAENTLRHRTARVSQLSVIENGINLDLYRPCPAWRSEVRAELGLPPDALVLGCVCRLADYKNVDLLLRAALPRLEERLQLLVVGDGPDRVKLESLASQHPNGKFVRFLGQRIDIPRLLNGLDLFALSSKTEGHPLAVIEAMATGLPVFATRVGGIPDMIEDGRTGFLSPLDESGFAERLASAIDRSESWRPMGQAARAEACERFSSETMAGRYLALYQGDRQGP